MAESLIIKILGDTKEFQKALKGTEASTAKLQEDLSKIAQKAAIAFAGLSATVGGLISTYRTQEQAEKKLETVLRSTGEAAGVTAQELKDMASGLQEVTTFGDEAIIEAQSLLLTFTKIGSDVFPQATESILNMSAALGTDLKSQALQVGKALNDPIAGVTALTRAGVSLTEQQKEQIKAFSESGDIVKAQTLILKELQIQFGGQARATAEGTGRFIQLKNTLGDVAEVVGKHLVPPLSAMAKKFNEILVDILKTKGEQFGKTASSILLIATNASILTAGLALTTKALITARVAVKALGLSMKGLKGAFASTLIGAAILGVSYAVEQFTRDFEINIKAVKNIWGVFVSFAGQTTDLLKKRFQFAFEALKAFGKAIMSIGSDIFNFFKKTSKAVLDFFKGPVKEAAEGYPDAIIRAHKRKNSEILENEKGFGSKILELVKSSTQQIKQVYDDAAEERKEARLTQQQEEEARLTDQANKREQRQMTIRKQTIDQEKFIMDAQKRETLNYKKSRELQDKIDEKKRKKEEDRRKEEIQNTKESLGVISGLTSSSNRDLFNIGKASAIAQAAINAPSAILKAWDTPWPLNLVLAPLVATAVGAQIAQIASASPPKMNDGGMIMGSPGIDQNLAMLSRGELVVPTRNFDEVVGAVAGSRDADIFGESQTVNVAISFEGDEASQVLTAHQIEDRALGVSREEVA